MFRFLLVLAVIPAAYNQVKEKVVRYAMSTKFITLRDGKIGVNFAGYHAEAGLGGLLTGNAAHGGLSASAGTPFGQRAGAGLGGTVDNGQTKGGLYAGASAGYGVGASAALGGNVDETGAAGGSGAEAHARGLSTKTVKLSQTPQYPQQVGIDQRIGEDESDFGNSNGINSGATGTYTATKTYQPNPNFFNDIFNIPISTLGAVNQFLNNGASSGYAVSKTKTVGK